ncbi:DNA-binding LytR/AlgR family response regulator [Aquimarina sp. EL_43]|uniref:LytR/AlgR family response regulator transcription factor n=1 Tax=unclassified Aquimarina TaxID=2627091 RepID=UPI0018C94C5F|nr:MULTISPECIES: response regulator transcription factor [unclassified Aquimarina]MBG6129493.1 DNA-binding LytR/AlgR family response regulator [Aquimarina sp. EL_35]MBG6150558.1 DNA-binding LytR/AlgR family response regulator [Aquimarina sp. EL_32]MBG6168134.1 DNA-binding LytR/AlgR family response regulator [Aquimarina sp. EL_43]
MNILIVEDESRIAKRIERMTRDIFGDTLQSLTHINRLHKALTYIETHSLDLVLLDLNLNGENGFDLLTTVVSQSFHTIVISAYKDQAITAFEYGVLDFVPKPFNRDRLEQAFNRTITKEKPENKIKYLAVKGRHRIQLIPIEDLLYIKGAGVYTELFLADGKKELHDKSLEKLEQLLSPTFERIHKSYLMKMSEVKEIVVKSGSKYMAELKNGELIPIGRTKYKDIKAKWL